MKTRVVLFLLEEKQLQKKELNWKNVFYEK